MNRRIYLDYGASTPLDKRVLAAMRPYFSTKYGNAGSSHFFGQEASAAIFKARLAIAKVIGAKNDEIIFTGSATEANNLVLRGAIKAAIRRGVKIPHIITSAFEHPSILATCRDLQADGVEVTYLPVTRDGFVDLEALEQALKENTVLVSVMYVNNEVGTIQPIFKISEIIQEFKTSHISHLTSNFSKIYPLFHSDAVQAFQYLDCDVNKLGVDLMTISAHKIYGPKGIGALCIRNSKLKNSKTILSPIITGGGQEPRGLNSGTPNTPYIVGFGEAVLINEKIKDKEAARVEALRDYAWRAIQKSVPKARLNGSHENRIENNINVYFPGRRAHELMIKLDLAGLAVSSGVACSARAVIPSITLMAMGLGEKRATESLRMTLGRPTTKNEIDYLVKQLALLK